MSPRSRRNQAALCTKADLQRRGVRCDGASFFVDTQGAIACWKRSTRVRWRWSDRTGGASSVSEPQQAPQAQRDRRHHRRPGQHHGFGRRFGPMRRYRIVTLQDAPSPSPPGRCWSSEAGSVEGENGGDAQRKSVRNLQLTASRPSVWPRLKICASAARFRPRSP